VQTAVQDGVVETEGAVPHWVVWRQDDHGNRSVVASFQTRADADRLADELEARGHKQLYWVAAGQ